MALIELVKRLTPARALYQSTLVRGALHRLAESRANSISGASFKRYVQEFELTAEEQRQMGYSAFRDGLTVAFIRVVDERVINQMGSATIGGAFNLPVEQMMPQLSSTLSMARIRFGRSIADSFIIPSPEAIRALIYSERFLGNNLLAALFGHSVLDVDDTYFEAGPTSDNYDREVEQDAGRFFELTQIEIGNQWKQYVRGTACWVAGGLGLAISFWRPGDVAVSSMTPIAATVGGGFLAWLTRDLTAVIERWRR